MKLFLGLDNGGTTTKAALFTIDGKELGVESVATAILTPKPGFIERDMEEMWSANQAVIKKLIERLNIDPSDIAGIGICGHGKGLYLWGKDNKPLRNGIISTDNRAFAYPKKWKENGTEDKAFELSCQHVMSCQPVALLAWLKDHEPENYRNIQWIFECKDYVRFRLTGVAKAEMTDTSGANLLNLHTGKYDPQLLELFGIPEVSSALPPLCHATEIAGYITEDAAVATGLLPGTPVIGGMFDIDACALAVGISDTEHVCMIAGTWSINEYIRKTPVLDGSVMMNSFYALPGYYLVEECSPTSAGNNEWFITQLLPEVKRAAKQENKNIYEIMNQWVSEISPCTFVPVFLPFIMASNVHPNAKGTLLGISTNHTRKHLVRAVYEGIVFCHKMHYLRLLSSMEQPPKSIRLAGGAAKSKIWAQMFADVLGIPVETVDVNESGALGCAIAVAVATGAYDSIESAIKGMCNIGAPIQPNPGLSRIYEEKYRLYTRSIECLDSLWDSMQSVIEMES